LKNNIILLKIYMKKIQVVLIYSNNWTYLSIDVVFGRRIYENYNIIKIFIKGCSKKNKEIINEKI
jgi:translation initiation factor 2 gamma subunit (eIF-2gamma)